MMGSPISPSDIVAIARFALDLYKACCAASDQFDAVGSQVLEMQRTLRLLKVIGKKDSILNANNEDGRQLRQDFKEQCASCKESLDELNKLLQKYGSMGWVDKLKWATGGKADVREVQAQMASSTIQLNTFLAGVNMWGIGIVHQDHKNMKRDQERWVEALDAIEERLRRHPDNEKEAVKEAMRVVGRNITREDAKECKTIIQEYAEEVKRTREKCGKADRAKTPEERGRNAQLRVPQGQKRASSADPPKKDGGKKDTPAQPPKKKVPNYTLECWLVKRSYLTERKEQQYRSQALLKEMAEQFKGSKLCLDKNDDTVKRILDDKNRDEDPRYRWYYVASRIEKGDPPPIMPLGTREQVMVIIKRQLTREAQKKQDEKERKEAEAATKRKEAKEEAEQKRKAEEEEKRKEAKKEAEVKKGKELHKQEVKQDKNAGENGKGKNDRNDSGKEQKKIGAKKPDHEDKENNKVLPKPKKEQNRGDASTVSRNTNISSQKREAGKDKKQPRQKKDENKQQRN